MAAEPTVKITQTEIDNTVKDFKMLRDMAEGRGDSLCQMCQCRFYPDCRLVSPHSSVHCLGIAADTTRLLSVGAEETGHPAEVRFKAELVQALGLPHSAGMKIPLEKLMRMRVQNSLHHLNDLLRMAGHCPFCYHQHRAAYTLEDFYAYKRYLKYT